MRIYGFFALVIVSFSVVGSEIDIDSCVNEFRFCLGQKCTGYDLDTYKACSASTSITYVDHNDVVYNTVGFTFEANICKIVVNDPNSAGVFTRTLIRSGRLVGCDEVNDCRVPAGTPMVAQSASTQEVDSFCQNGCSYSSADEPVIVNGSFTYPYISTGGNCTDDFEDAGWTQAPTTTSGGTNAQGSAEACTSTASGGEFCYQWPQAGQAGQNCGEYNGVDICTADMPDTGQCNFMSGGSYICEAQASDSVRPLKDGEVARADVSGDFAGGTADIYDAATVSESDNINLPWGQVPGAGGWSGTGSGGNPGDGSGDGETPQVEVDAGEIGDEVAESIDEEAEEDAENFSVPAFEGNQSRIDEIHGAFSSKISSSPVFQMINSVQLDSYQGECPTPQFSAFGQIFVFDVHCSLIAEITLALSALFIAGYVILGIKIIASA